MVIKKLAVQDFFFVLFAALTIKIISYKSILISRYYDKHLPFFICLSTLFPLPSTAVQQNWSKMKKIGRFSSTKLRLYRFIL